MHKNFPKYFAYISSYNQDIFDINITNLGIIYRNYSNKINIDEIKKISLKCKKKKFKLFIANNAGLACKINADGIYIPSFNKKKIIRPALSKNKFLIIGSAHNQREIFEKQKQECKVIFLSSLFKSKKKKYLGICKFNLIAQSNKTKFIALGGINEKLFKLLKITNSSGFAGISFFKKKTGLKLIRPV